MQRISLLNIAHNILREHIQINDIVIDATIGNGHDTLFLANQIGPLGKVFGFDIQQTLNRFRTHFQLDCLSLFHASHETMAEKIPRQFHGNISAIMFNLGYLPGGDKSIITSTHSTINTLNTACSLLSDKGIITVIAYPGHKGGKKETAEIKIWSDLLKKDLFNIDIITSQIDNDLSPILFIIKKLSNIN